MAAREEFDPSLLGFEKCYGEFAFVRKVRVFSLNEIVGDADPGHNIAVFGIVNRLSLLNFFHKWDINGSNEEDPDGVVIERFIDVLKEYSFIPEDSTRFPVGRGGPYGNQLSTRSYYRDLVTFQGFDILNPDFSSNLFQAIDHPLFLNSTTQVLQEQLSCCLTKYSGLNGVSDVGRMLIFIEIDRSRIMVLSKYDMLYNNIETYPGWYDISNRCRSNNEELLLPPFVDVFRPDLYLRELLPFNPMSKIPGSMLRFPNQYDLLLTDTNPSFGDLSSEVERVVSSVWSVLGFVRARLLSMYSIMNMNAFINDRAAGLISLPITRPPPDAGSFFRVLSPTVAQQSADVCSICYDDLINNPIDEPFVELCCPHSFHYECISKVLFPKQYQLAPAEKVRCPLCRHVFYYHD